MDGGVDRRIFAPDASPRGVCWVAGALLLLAGLAVAFVEVVVRRHDPLRHLAERLPWLARRLDAGVWHGLTLTVSAIAVFVGFGAFSEITQHVVGEADLVTLDRAVNTWMAQHVPPGAFRFLHGVTHFGDHDTLLWASVALGAVLLLRRYVWLFGAFILAMGGGQLFNVLLKGYFARVRPINTLHAGGYSFPSGHSSGAMLLYGFLVFLLWTTKASRLLKWAGTVLLGLLILLVGLSRIVLSVHWMSDVLGGFVLGLTWLTFSLVAVRALAAWRRADRVYGRPQRHIPGEMPGDAPDLPDPSAAP